MLLQSLVTATGPLTRNVMDVVASIQIVLRGSCRMTTRDHSPIFEVLIELSLAHACFSDIIEAAAPALVLMSAVLEVLS
jgi:hypothetical protein